MMNLVYQQKSKSLSVVSAVVVQSEHSGISIMNCLRFVLCSELCCIHVEWADILRTYAGVVDSRDGGREGVVEA
jgi:hypothetical protein